MKNVELNVRCTSGYKSYQEGIPLYLHNRPKSLTKHLLLLNNSVNTLMNDSVKPDDGKVSVTPRWILMREKVEKHAMLS